MDLFRVGPLPDAPLDAAARFHTVELPRIRAVLGGARDLTLLFAPADHTHRAWRLAAVQELARARAPGRLNALESDDEDAIAAALRYVAFAQGLTGQVLPLDGMGAGPILYIGQ